MPHLDLPKMWMRLAIFPRAFLGNSGFYSGCTFKNRGSHDSCSVGGLTRMLCRSSPDSWRKQVRLPTTNFNRSEDRLGKKSNRYCTDECTDKQ